MTEISPEEMMEAVAASKAQQMGIDLVANYNARVDKIDKIRRKKIPAEDRPRVEAIYDQDVKAKKGKPLGKDVQYYSNVKYKALPDQMKADIKKLCENTGGFYCVSSYTTSLHEIMKPYGYDKSNGLFVKGDPKLKGTDLSEAYANTGRAIEYVETYFGDAGTSLKDFLKDHPECKNLGDALKLMHQKGDLPIGSMIMVESSGNTVSGRHCVMFMGIDKDGRPLYSSNNPEIKCKPNDGWSNQTADGKNPPHIINTEQIIAIKQMEMERQEMLEMGAEAYYAAHQAEIDQYMAAKTAREAEAGNREAPAPENAPASAPAKEEVKEELRQEIHLKAEERVTEKTVQKIEEQSRQGNDNREMSPADRARLLSEQNKGEVERRTLNGNTAEQLPAQRTGYRDALANQGAGR